MAATLVEKPADVQYPPFVAGTTYALGARVLVPSGDVLEKLTKTSKVTTLPKVGSTWKLFLAAPAKPSDSALVRTFSQLRGVMPNVPGQVYLMPDEGKLGYWQQLQSATTLPDNTGTLIISANGLPFKRLYEGALLATWFGMVPNDPVMLHENSRILDGMLKTNPFVYVKLNGYGNRYYVGHNAQNRVWADSPYCIDCIDFRGTLEGDNGVQIVWELGYTCIQINRTVGECGGYFYNFGLDGQAGMFTNYQRTYLVVNEQGQLEERYSEDYGETDEKRNYVPIGKPNAYNRDWGQYKHCAIALMGMARFDRVTVSNCAGNGVNHFADTTIRFNGLPFDLKGEARIWNGNVVLTLDTDEMFDQVPAGEPYAILTVGEVQTGVANKGILGPRTVSIGYASQLPFKDGDRVEGTAYQPGKKLNADSVQMNIQFENIGGSAVFTSGDEANQGIWMGVRMGDIGGPGFCDSSLLNNLLIADHYTRCGGHFREVIDGKEVYHCPPFTNRGNRGKTTKLHSYYETDQGWPEGDWYTLQLGGINEMGMNGMHGISGRNLLNVTLANNGVTRIEQDPNGFRFTLENGKTLLLAASDTGQLCYAGQPVAALDS